GGVAGLRRPTELTDPTDPTDGMTAVENRAEGPAEERAEECDAGRPAERYRWHLEAAECALAGLSEEPAVTC
ncbi:MAG: hypothetical protein M3R02_24885, partial [Chloroflexota bacterium]|nr:hypothetical protein [Chloroflexota bacterium]